MIEFIKVVLVAIIVVGVFFIATKYNNKHNTSNSEGITVELNIDSIFKECDKYNSNTSTIVIDDKLITLTCDNSIEIVWKVEYLGINKDTK